MKAVVVLCLIPLIIAHNDRGGETNEFCQDETFRAVCGKENQVILVDKAVFGRMRLGRCIKQNIANMIGCQKSALQFLDSRCGGRRACNQSVMDPHLRKLHPCSTEVTWHLEIAYHCVSVVDSCKTMKSLHLNMAPPDFISSSSLPCSYALHAMSGQRINFTIFNFFRSNSVSTRQSIYLPPHSNTCLHAGYISEDVSEHTFIQNITICKNDARVKVFYTSQTPHVSLHTQPSPHVFEGAYLIHYQVTGCILPQISGATLSKQGETLVVKCNSSGDVWYLTCSPDSNNYLGELGNCSHTAAATNWTADELFNPGAYFPFGILLVVAVGVALGIFLGGTLLLIASLFMKKKHCRHEMMEEGTDQLHDHTEECKTLGASDYLVHYNHLTTPNLPIFHPHSHLVYEKHLLAPEYSSKAAFKERSLNEENKLDHRCPYYESPHII